MSHDILFLIALFLAVIGLYVHAARTFGVRWVLNVLLGILKLTFVVSISMAVVIGFIHGLIPLISSDFYDTISDSDYEDALALITIILIFVVVFGMVFLWGKFTKSRTSNKDR